MTAGRITVHQWEPGRHPRDNLEVIHEVVRNARAEGSTLAVFPEYSSALDAGGPSAQTETVTRQGEWVGALRDVTRETGVSVVVGALVRSESAALPHNTMMAFSDGELVAAAHKLHLYDAFGARESDAIAPGDIEACELFEWEGLRVGMMACYDLRFPEVARRLVDAGATALVVPAQWMAGDNKTLHWETLLRARAIENQVWVVGVNQPAPLAVGASQVIDPLGQRVLTLGEAAETAGCELNVVDVTDARRENPMMVARRFGVEPRA